MKQFFCVLIVFNTCHVAAQETDSCENKSWKFTAWADQFIIPAGEDFLNPTFYAVHNKLHLEARYNYEDRNTVSFWAGKRLLFGEGKKLKYHFVPMIGFVFGRTNGIAPGLETTFEYKKFDLYTESEYVFDYREQENNFFYLFAQLGFSPIKSIRTGIVSQVTRIFETPKQWQHGVFAEYYFGKCQRFRTGIFYFSPFYPDDFWMLSGSVEF